MLDSLSASTQPALPEWRAVRPPITYILLKHTKSASFKEHKILCAEVQSLKESHLRSCPQSVSDLHYSNTTHSMAALSREMTNMFNSLCGEMHTGFARTDSHIRIGFTIGRLVLCQAVVFDNAKDS